MEHENEGVSKRGMEDTDEDEYDDDDKRESPQKHDDEDKDKHENEDEHENQDKYEYEDKNNMPVSPAIDAGMAVPPVYVAGERHLDQDETTLDGADEGLLRIEVARPVV